MSKTLCTTSSAPGSDPRQLSGTAKTEHCKQTGGRKEDVSEVLEERGQITLNVHSGLHSLRVLFLVVVTEEQAGEGTSAVWQPLVETPKGHGVVTNTNTALKQRHDQVFCQSSFAFNIYFLYLLSHLPGLVLPTLYVNLPEFDKAIVASGGQDSTIWRQGTFTDSLEVHKHKLGLWLLFLHS